MRTFLFMTGLALIAAAPGEEMDEAFVPSGFLEDFDQLTPDDESETLLVYRKQEGILKQYDRFIVPRVLIYLSQEAGGKGFDPADLMMLTEYFHQQATEQLEKAEGYDITDTPGERVAVIRLAITGLNSSKGGVNAVLKAAGAATGVGVLVPSVDIGGASIEGEIIDSVTGERLVAFADSKKGRRMMNLRSVKQWGDAKKAFKKWCKQFRELLDRIHAERE